MNASEELQKWSKKDVDSNTDFDQIEENLEAKLEEEMAELQSLEEDREKIGNPESLGNTVMNVVWEQFVNQIAVFAGEDFIKENRGLSLDLRDSAHIQSAEGFQQASDNNSRINSLFNEIDKLEAMIDSGQASKFDILKKNKLEYELNNYIAGHNEKGGYKQKYKDWDSKFKHDEKGNVITKYDRIDNENKPELNDGYRAPYDSARNKDKSNKVGSAQVHMDETVSVKEQVRRADTNVYLTEEERIEFDLSDSNLNPMDSRANPSKGDHNADNWLDSERNGQKPAERFDIDEKQIREKNEEARSELDKRLEKGKKQANETGKQSQREEAFRIGGKALRSVLMGMLASLVKDIIRQLVVWFRSGERKLSSFIDSVKKAIRSFVTNIKLHLLTAGNTLVTTIATAILGPVVGMIKKSWIFLKQGYKSVKDAIEFFKDPKNKNMPFSLKMLNVGKIVIAGLTAGGAIVLGEVIEKGLMTIPIFAFEIPLFGSLASILGIFFGALVSGLIGALALNLIDRLIAKKQKSLNTEQQIDAINNILTTQGQLIDITEEKAKAKMENTANSIQHQHELGAQMVKDSSEGIKENADAIKKNAETIKKNSKDVCDTSNDLNSSIDSDLDILQSTLNDL